MRRLGLACLALAAGLAATLARAGVTPDEANRLKTTLTPVGAERMGNKEGTIPAWTGGVTTPSPGWREGQARPDPFAREKPLFSISAANLAAYADKLPEGARELFRRNPDYRMDVYPSHRSAALPAAVYDAVFRNATAAHAAPAGIAHGVDGAIGGVPFPIPKNGFEVVWNHLLAYWGAARATRISTHVVAADGAMEPATTYDEIADFPYYYKGATAASLDGYYFKTRHTEIAPPMRAGESYVAWQPIDTARHKFAAWRLVPGERRVRRAPSISYDVPDPDASGFENMDEYYLFFGGPDRYDFKLLGKKEMYVPYNNNRLYTRPASEIIGPKHANPDDLRYELHRVWVVEGTLAPGAHHVAPRRRLYVDEDTWFAVYADSWDDRGKLWKFAHGTMYLMPDEPAVVLGSQFVYDFDLGGYVYGFALDGAPYRITAPHPAQDFSPEALAAGAVR